MNAVRCLVAVASVSAETARHPKFPLVGTHPALAETLPINGADPMISIQSVLRKSGDQIKNPI